MVHRIYWIAYKERYPMIFEVFEGENVSFAMSDYYRRQFERYNDADYFVFCDQDDVWMPDKLKVGSGS